MPSYMITLRTADDGDAPSPTPRYLKFADPASAPVEMDPAKWRTEVIAQFPKAKTTPKVRAGDLVFFVHGFNVDFKAACNSHFQMSDSLAKAGFNGGFISFDWPSAGLTFAYLSDREHARLASNALITSGIAMLRDAQTQDCLINLHVMAHSMGGFVVQQAFTQSYQDVPPDWRVGQLIFVAADVDYTVFSADNPSAKAFGAHAGRLTAYCNRSDKALAVSNAKRLGLAPRMGRVGLPNDAPPSMCEVDCSALFDAAFPSLTSHLDPVATHCFYFQQDVFWQDVVLTLAGGLDRSVIPTRGPAVPVIEDRFVVHTAPMSSGDYATALLKASQGPTFSPV